MDVNQIFKDLALMIHDQGEIIGELCDAYKQEDFSACPRP